MECPAGGDALGAALQRCPFLHNLCANHGEQYARAIALDPTGPANKPAARSQAEEVAAYRSSLAFFHGRGGVVPLRSCEETAEGGAFWPVQSGVKVSGSAEAAGKPPAARHHALTAPSLASIGMSFFGGGVRRCTAPSATPHAPMPVTRTPRADPH